MNLKRPIVSILLSAATIASFSSCQSGDGISPTSPVTFVPKVSIAPPSTQPDVNPAPAPLAKEIFDFEILSNIGTWTVSLTNLSDKRSRVGVACYENPTQTRGEDQTYFSSHSSSISVGGTVTESASIPECVYWQCDAFEGDAITEGDPFYGRRLIVGRSGSPQGDCSTTTTIPPSCDREKLEQNARLTCEEGPFILDLASCTFECKPPSCDIEALGRRANADAKETCVHGVEIIALDMNICTYSFECKPPPQECEIPESGGPFPKQGNPRDECSFFGDFVPGHPADFFICKAGFEIFVSPSPFRGLTCPNGKDISHITECVHRVCEDD